jgi:hypothetical protein
MQKTKQKFRILSPDGFDINPAKITYSSPIQVLRALIQFRDRYSFQGYYSSNFGRIDLRSIPYECSVISL